MSIPTSISVTSTSGQGFFLCTSRAILSPRSRSRSPSAQSSNLPSLWLPEAAFLPLFYSSLTSVFFCSVCVCVCVWGEVYPFCVDVSLVDGEASSSNEPLCLFFLCGGATVAASAWPAPGRGLEQDMSSCQACLSASAAAAEAVCVRFSPAKRTLLPSSSSCFFFVPSAFSKTLPGRHVILRLSFILSFFLLLRIRFYL